MDIVFKKYLCSELHNHEMRQWVQEAGLLWQMAKHAWLSYKEYAWGSNELRPVSKGGSSGVFGAALNGATIGRSTKTTPLP
jgi:hypothetical protein